MGRFRNAESGVVVSVDDAKDDRFADGRWESADQPAPDKKSAKRSSPSKSEK